MALPGARLQFQRSSRPGYAPVAKGEMFLDVHIPEGGSLSPDSCDASFGAAPAFFARYFPEDRPRVFVCASWLLDLPQNTVLERAVVAHYRAGGRIGAGLGVIPIE